MKKIVSTDGESVYVDTPYGNVFAEVDPVSGRTRLVGIASGLPFLSFRGCGSVASPIGHIVTVNVTSGLFPLDQELRIPSNTLIKGSKIVGQIKVHHTGTAETTPVVYAWLGTTGTPQDAQILATAINWSGSSPLAGVLTFDVDVTSESTVYSSTESRVPNAGYSISQHTTDYTSSQFNIGQEMFIVFGFTCAGFGGGGDTWRLISYDVQVYK